MVADAFQISPEALFRYQWVAEVEARVLGGETVAAAITAALRGPRPDPRGEPRQPSRRSLYRWYAAYQEDGIAGLEPAIRPRVEESRALGPKMIRLLREAKKLDPELSVPDLIELARSRGVLGAEERVSRTTVWRACRRMGLPLRRRHRLETADTRRWSYPHRMMMVLADGKYFRAGPRRLKRVALTFLDDATRFGLGIVVGTTETTELFLRGLHAVLLRYGLMNAFFLDRGPGFISHDTKSVFARLDRQFIYGRRRYPEGRGKVERYNRTLLHKVLRTFPGKPEVDPDCRALTFRLTHWLRERYNHTPHEGIDGDTPAERWLADERDLELPRDRQWLDEQFRTTLERTVSNDHVVSIDGTAYEVPSACHGRIEIIRHLLSGRLTVEVDEEDVEIHPLDPTKNAFDRRARTKAAPKTKTDTPQSAATEEFDETYGSVLDDSGGFPDPEDT